MTDIKNLVNIFDKLAGLNFNSAQSGKKLAKMSQMYFLQKFIQEARWRWIKKIFFWKNKNFDTNIQNGKNVNKQLISIS